MKLSELRANQTAAYAGPFLVFMIFNLLLGLVKSSVAGLPWWRSDAEHWVYPIQTTCCLLLLWWWRAHYRLDFAKKTPWSAVVLGAGCGLLGLGIWLIPGWIFQTWGDFHLPPGVAKYLGLFDRHGEHGEGFNPDIFPEGSAAYITSLSFRFLRMGLAVALVEEIFWRGFLWRYLSAEYDPRWWKQPFAQPWTKGFWGTVAIWPLVHLGPDFLGCVAYGFMISFLVVRTRSILSGVICHAVTNIGLGIYVLKTGLWNYW